MNRIKITDNFYLDEFIPPEIYSVRGASSIELLDIRIIAGVQFIREKAEAKYGSGVSFTVNNWFNKGTRHESGLRLPNTRTGAKWSQHKYGRAVDIVPKGLSVAQLFEIVKENERYLLDSGFITTVENIAFTKTWLHVDCRYTGLDSLRIVNP
jgi:hypothetical protein